MKKILVFLLVITMLLTSCNHKIDNENKFVLEKVSRLYSENYQNSEYYHMGVYEECHVILIHLDHYAPNYNGDSIGNEFLYFEFGENKIKHACPFLALYAYIEDHDKLYTLSFAYEMGLINDNHIVEIKNKYEKLDEKYFNLKYFVPTIIKEFPRNEMIE